MNASDIHHLAAAYALDALDREERLAFEAHYTDCEICSREVEEFRETAAFLADGASVEPPTTLKQNVMAGVAQSRQLAPLLPDTVIDLAEQHRRRDRRNSVLTAAAAAVIAVLGTVAALRLGSGSPGDNVGDLVAAPDAVVSALQGDEGSLRVVWSAEQSSIAVLGHDLPPLDAGSTYELWFLLEDGSVAPAGLFEPDESGAVRTVLPIDPITGIGWGVTVEPNGGSPQPTSDVVYAAEF